MLTAPEKRHGKELVVTFFLPLNYRGDASLTLKL